MVINRWNINPQSQLDSDAINEITEALKAVGIANQTWTTAELNRLGFTYAFNNDGQTLYVIADYPGRHTNDLFKDVFLVEPVGEHVTDRDTGQHFYTLRIPERIGKAAVKAPDLTPYIVMLNQYGEQFREQHECFGVSDEILVPMFFVLEDTGDILKCLKFGLHPKKIAELMSAGYTVDEVVENRDVPSNWLLELKR